MMDHSGLPNDSCGSIRRFENVQDINFKYKHNWGMPRWFKSVPNYSQASDSSPDFECGFYYKVDSNGNEKLIRKWTKSVFLIRDQKFGQADSYGNEKLL